MKRLAMSALLLVGCAGDVKDQLTQTYGSVLDSPTVSCWYNTLDVKYATCVVSTATKNTGFVCVRGVTEWLCEPMLGAAFAVTKETE